GIYRFTVTADDGVRLFIDGKKFLDQWRDQAAATYTFEAPMTAGNHEIVLEYYEHSGSAIVKLSWSPAPCNATVSPSRWRGEDFNTRNLNAPRMLPGEDGEVFLDLVWRPGTQGGVGAPPADGFSARWVRTVAFAEGVYRFNLNADDGVRLYIDNQLKLDRW